LNHPLGAGDAVCRYEQLRHCVCGGGNPNPFPQLELELIRCRGIPGWLRWADALELAAPADRRREVAGAADGPPRGVRAGNQEMVAALSSMILECLEVTR